MRSIPASKFKAQCLALLDEVAETGETLVVTKRGKAVARVVPLEEPATLIGTFEQRCSDEELVYFSLDWGEGDTELLRAADE